MTWLLTIYYYEIGLYLVPPLAQVGGILVEYKPKAWWTRLGFWTWYLSALTFCATDEELVLSTECLLGQITTTGFPQQADDFFWFVSFLLHCELFCLSKTFHSLWASFSGGGHTFQPLVTLPCKLSILPESSLMPDQTIDLTNRTSRKTVKILFYIIARFITVVSLTVSMGGHWGLLQTIGWANMYLDYSKDCSLISAISKTFDSETTCEICELVRAGKKQESHQDFLKSNFKLDLFQEGASIELIDPIVEQDQKCVVIKLGTRRFPPDIPPPRLA